MSLEQYVTRENSSLWTLLLTLGNSYNQDLNYPHTGNFFTPSCKIHLKYAHMQRHSHTVFLHALLCNCNVGWAEQWPPIEALIRFIWNGSSHWTCLLCMPRATFPLHKSFSRSLAHISVWFGFLKKYLHLDFSLHCHMCDIFLSQTSSHFYMCVWQSS